MKILFDVMGGDNAPQAPIEAAIRATKELGVHMVLVGDTDIINGELKKYNGKLPTTRKIYCLEENKIYNSSKEIAELWKLKSVNGIHNVCNHKQNNNTVRGKHLFWYDEYIHMDKNTLNNYLEKTKNKCFRSVICLNTSEIFESIADAGRKNKYNASSECIRDCCSGRNKSSGRMPDGTAVQWMYYDEYCKLLENKKEIVLNYKEKGIEVICTTTGKIFKNIKLGAKEYNISPTSVSSACKGNFRFAGKLSDGTKLKWMFYEDFFKLSIEEQNEILSRNQESSNDGSFIM